MMITKFAINNSILTLAILLVLVLSGISTFESMPRDDMPPFLIRYVSVVTAFPGASPQRVENLITDRIEKVVQEVPQVDNITSESRTGISIVNIAIKESETELQPIFDRIRRKVEGMEHRLPEGSRVTIKDEVGDVFGIIVGLTAEGYSHAEMKEIADDIRDGLIKLSNAAKVEIVGIQEEKIYLEFDEARLAKLKLSKQKLQGIISTTNIIFPGGDIKVGDRRIILEPTGSYESLDDLRKTVVSVHGGEIVRLGDITQIRQGYTEPRKSIVTINGERGLAIGINLKEGGNIIQLGREVDRKIEEYLEVYPHGVEIERVASQDVVVDKSVGDFTGNLIQAAVVVLLVMLVLLGLRTGLVVASLIPVTMVMSFWIMSALGVGLNKVTLASLIVALGMLVDNAIVVSESVMIKMERGVGALEAAVESAGELTIPLLVSSLTTSAAFMAFYLAESVMGEVMGLLFVVVTIALLSSWFLSFTVITLFCVRFIKAKKQRKNGRDYFQKIVVAYRSLLLSSLRKPYLVISACIVLFVLALYLFRFVPVIFMPKSDRPLVTVNIELPLGTGIERTEAVVADIETFVEEQLLVDDRRKEGVTSWSAYIGEGAPKYDLGYNPPESAPNAAHILINTSSDGANDSIIRRLDDYIFAGFPDVTAHVSRLLSTGGSVYPVAIRISGKEPSKLFRIVDELKTRLAEIPGAKNISDDWGLRTKKLMVRIDLGKAQMAGISNQDIAVSLQAALSGSQIGSLREGEKEIPIVMRSRNTDRMDIGDLESLNIYAQQSGKNVPLKQIADIEVVWQESKILRRDLYKTITVNCDLQPGTTAAEIVDGISPWLEDAQSGWGIGYKYSLGGDAEGSAKAMNAVIVKLPLAGFVILLLLVWQFNSVRKPFIILMTIPLGIIGVTFGLLVARSYFGFVAFLGIISLAGIVVNNAIVLLDRIQVEQEKNGRTPQEAVLEAAQHRFRPILLTTATTTLGLIPLWIGGGVMWQPMAITIIFGLLFATVLTLLLVPTVYRVLFRISYREY
ncbi:MAG: efflux RND transporter permease subunit [Proteobacteria bacterium]|nr:efflux RND transporter permease subunit [Pseudomonadota bacterium]